METVLWERAPVGEASRDAGGAVEYRTLTLYNLVNDVLMALFFAVAAKEVWEAVALRHGALRGAKAAVPLIATAGGMLGPVLVYLGLAAALGSETFDAVARGWAIPTATDIAFSYIVARAIFGAATRRSASSCSWPSPTTQAASSSSPSSTPRATSSPPGSSCRSAPRSPRGSGPTASPSSSTRGAS